MATLDQQITRVRHKCVKNVKRRARKCLIEGCSEWAINSHVIQQKGILNKISESGFVYRPIPDGFNKCIKFTKVSIKKPCTYKILCKKHDSEIFKNIEKGDVDFLDPRSLLLLSYRAVLAEIVKLENILTATKLEVEDKHLMAHVNDEKFDVHVKEKEAHISRLYSYKCLLEEDVYGSEIKNFIFLTRVVDRVQLCASSIFSDARGGFLDVVKFKGLDIAFLPEVVFNIVPVDSDKSILSLGFLKRYDPYISSFLKSLPYGSPEETESLINDILLRSINYWFSSPSFYEEFIKGRERELSEQIKEAVSNRMCRLGLNLFKV